MRLRYVGGEDNEVRVSMGRRDRAAYSMVLRSAIRWGVMHEGGTGQYSASLNRQLGQTLVDARIGFLRTTMRVGEGTLAGIQEHLGSYGEDGIPDEVASNPNADLVQLAKVAQRAGGMAIQIENYFASRPEEA